MKRTIAMAGITITEALAEIKTVGKRIEKKREFINQFLARQDGVRDPLEKDGGSTAVITAERQAIGDLENRIVELRRGIQRANDSTVVAINGVSRTISEWLTWRRDIAPGQRNWFANVRGQINHVRENAKRQGVALVQANATSGDTKPTDLVVNIDERTLAADAEALEDTFGQLDGQLSLKNATITI
jgi:hypothetical protein